MSDEVTESEPMSPAVEKCRQWLDRELDDMKWSEAVLDLARDGCKHTVRNAKATLSEADFAVFQAYAGKKCDPEDLTSWLADEEKWSDWYKSRDLR
jgi:hypothetical protein